MRKIKGIRGERANKKKVLWERNFKNTDENRERERDKSKEEEKGVDQISHSVRERLGVHPLAREARPSGIYKKGFLSEIKKIVPAQHFSFLVFVLSLVMLRIATQPHYTTAPIARARKHGNTTEARRHFKLVWR